jgi:hypothetical protein
MSSISGSDYSPDPTAPAVKRRPRGSMTAEERREARANRNRLAAQSSRDRKKVQFEQLAQRIAELEEENRSLRLNIGRPSLSSSAATSSAALTDAVVIQENAELQERIEQLERAWQNMSRILGSVSIPLPQPPASSPYNFSRSTPSLPTALPISPAMSSVPDTIDAVTRSTRELARFANISFLQMSLQRVAPSSRASIIRLLSEQDEWGRPRCSTMGQQSVTSPTQALCH